MILWYALWHIRIGSCSLCVYWGMDALGRFGDHKRSVRVDWGITYNFPWVLSRLLEKLVNLQLFSSEISPQSSLLTLILKHFIFLNWRNFFPETSASTDSDKIDAAEAKRMITVIELTRLTENKLPETGNVISQAFWCAEEDIEKMELLQGDPVRLKTKGEGPFIGNLTILHYLQNGLCLGLSFWLLLLPQQ